MLSLKVKDIFTEKSFLVKKGFGSVNSGCYIYRVIRNNKNKGYAKRRN